MALTRWDRKERLRIGDVKLIAEELRAQGEKVSPPEVSLVLHDRCSHMNPEKVRKIQVAIAKRLRPRISVAEAFGLEETVAA